MELHGKIINFLGDSITEGSGVTDPENNRYDNVLKRRCGLKAVHNYGIGGTRIAHQRVPSAVKPRHDLCFCGRAYDLNPEADIFVVYGGINDYLHGDAPMGTPEDVTAATFCGAVNFLMNLLKERYPGKTYVFMTPAHSYYQEMREWNPSTRPTKAPDAQPVTEYIRIIEEAGLRHGIPVLNMYENLGLDPNNPEHWQRYTVDGLHFNDEGHAFIADCLEKFLRDL